MPKKFFKKSTKKRFYKRRYRRRPIRRTLGIPKARFTKLKWAAHYQFNLAAAAGSVAEFRLNGPYDPVVAVGGTQPYYFDQYTAMYQRYRVYGCKVTILAAANSGTATCIWPSTLLASYCDAAPSWATMDVASTAKGNLLRLLPLGQQKVVMSKYYNLPNLAGVAKKEYNVAEVFQALCTTTPSRSINCQVWFQNNDVAATVNAQYWIHMTYYVKFFDPVEPAGS